MASGDRILVRFLIVLTADSMDELLAEEGGLGKKLAEEGVIGEGGADRLV